VSALEVVFVVSVLVGMSVQGAIGFGFGLVAAPAAFAAYSASEAVLLIQAFGTAISGLVLFAEGRRADVATRATATLVIAGIPGMVAGVFVLNAVDKQPLQLALGVMILIAVVVQYAATRAGPAEEHRAPALEAGSGLVAGVLSTSVSVNGPPIVLLFSHLGLRGSRLRDTLSASLLAFAIGAIAAVLIGSGISGDPPGAAVLIACVVALLAGHRFGAAVFRRLDDATHQNAALAAVAVAGVFSIVAALTG
jgi:uncharacterized membrane protein YfcA